MCAYYGAFTLREIMIDIMPPGTGWPIKLGIRSPQSRLIIGGHFHPALLFILTRAPFRMAPYGPMDAAMRLDRVLLIPNGARSSLPAGAKSWRSEGLRCEESKG